VKILCAYYYAQLRYAVLFVRSNFKYGFVRSLHKRRSGAQSFLRLHKYEIVRLRYEIFVFCLHIEVSIMPALFAGDWPHQTCAVNNMTAFLRFFSFQLCSLYLVLKSAPVRAF
jgi:hypothetical protein